MGIGFFSVAALLFWKKSKDPFVLFASIVLIAFGTDFSLDTLREVYPSMIWATSVIHFISSCTLIFFFVFPDGRFVPAWTKYVAGFWLLTSFARIYLPNSLLSSTIWPIWLDVPVWIGFYILALYVQIYRYRKVSDRVQREKTKWFFLFLAAGVLMVIWIGLFADMEGAMLKVIGELVTTVIALIMPVSLAIAILRYKLWDIDLWINRFAVYVMITRWKRTASEI